MEQDYKAIENKEQYSAYMANQSNLSTIWALFSGFTFTVTTVILTQFPNLTETTAQITLFVLAVMLDLFLYHLLTARLALQNCVRIAPPIPNTWLRMEKISLIFDYTSWIFLHLSVMLMYFLWNLLYLTLASEVVAVIFILFTNLAVVRPYWNFQRQYARK